MNVGKIEAFFDFLDSYFQDASWGSLKSHKLLAVSGWGFSGILILTLGIQKYRLNKANEYLKVYRTAFSDSLKTAVENMERTEEYKRAGIVPMTPVDYLNFDVQKPKKVKRKRKTVLRVHKRS